MVEQTTIKKQTKRFIVPINVMIVGIPIILLLTSVAVIFLIWIEINKKSNLELETSQINKNLNALDDIKFTNAELTERLNVIEEILKRDQNISSIFAYVVSQISNQIIKVENLSKSFDGTYEVKVAVSSIKNGADLFQKMSEIENIKELKLLNSQKVIGEDQYSFTISFKYKDGLSE